MKCIKFIIFCIILSGLGCISSEGWHTSKAKLTLTSSSGSNSSDDDQAKPWDGTSVGIRILEGRRPGDSQKESTNGHRDSAEKATNVATGPDGASSLNFAKAKEAQSDDNQPAESTGRNILDGLRLELPAARSAEQQTVRLLSAQEQEPLPRLPGSPDHPEPQDRTAGSPTAKQPVLPEPSPLFPSKLPDSTTPATPAQQPVSTPVEQPVPTVPGEVKSQPPEQRRPAASEVPGPPAIAGTPVYESTEGVPLEQLLTYALEHHPLLKARQHEVEIAQARLITAGLLPNPQLVLDTETPTRTIDDTSLSTRLVFTIPLGGKRNLARRAAQAAIERAQHRLSRETETVLASAALAAVDVLYYQELTHLRAQLAELAARGAEVQRARFELRAIPFADKMVAEVDAAEARVQHLDAVARLEAARIKLAQLVGLTPPRPIAVKGRLAAPPIDVVPLEVVLAQALTVRPELAETRAAVNESQWRVALARASAIPNLEIGPRFQTDIGAWNDRVGARVAFDVPLFDRKQGDIAEQQALLQTNCALRDLSELNSLGDVAAAYCELVPLRAMLDYYEKEVLPLAHSTEEAILKAYEAKTIEAIEVSDLQRKFGRMRLNYLDLRYRYNQLLVRLELLLGRKLSDLAQPQSRTPARPD